jgi:Fur family transcriptional regulator, ferric uptake regulator
VTERENEKAFSLWIESTLNHAYCQRHTQQDRERTLVSGQLWYDATMQRGTAQRRAILEALHEAPGPLTAQELHGRAREAVEGLGLATVYRNLNELERSGQVVSVHLPGDATRYEPSGRGHHHHFRCVRCDTVFELDVGCPLALLEDVTLPGGLQVTGHELVLFGLCRECAKASGGHARPSVPGSG